MIGHEIGEVLAFGVGVALSPLAIVALVVMLVPRGGVLPAWTFAGTWVVSLTFASTLVLLLADGADASATAAGLAVLFVVKPKNLLLTIGAGIAVAQAGVSPAAQVVGVAAFVALGTVGLAIPLTSTHLCAIEGETCSSGYASGWWVKTRRSSPSCAS